MASDDAILQLDAVSRSFGRVRAVDRLSESFARGEYFCILGPSGCGKTTLLRLIAGFETPDAGAIRLQGRDVATVPPEKRDVNVVFQSYALFPHLSVRDNIGFGLRMRGTPRGEIAQRVDETIRLVQLEREAARMPAQLSGGQQQRVALARALVNRPAVLLLDEPLSALDQSLRQAMQEELRRIQRETRVTFLHITHDQHEALALADRIAVMRHGRFLQVDSPARIYREPATAFVAAFVGATNLVPAQVLDHTTARVGVVDVVTAPHTYAAGSDALLAVRPEAVRIGHGPLTGIVRSVAFAGAVHEVTLELTGGAALRVHLPAQASAPAVGDVVSAAFAGDAPRLLEPDPA